MEILQLPLHGLRVVHLLLHLLHAPLELLDPGELLDDLGLALILQPLLLLDL